MLDHKIKPWLIEINHTPSFTADTPFDTELKTNLISDTLSIVHMDYANKEKYKIF